MLVLKTFEAEPNISIKTAKIKSEPDYSLAVLLPNKSSSKS